jgi:4-amino-4-deoxy-L-arabinose transferase-like glycosyltransferase
MAEARRRVLGLAGVVGLAALTLGVGLGRSGRLTYHEAIWAQAAREMLASGSVLVPTVSGRPWLEKPPLGPWLIALAGQCAGGIDEATARAPSALAGLALALGLAGWAARRFGSRIGGLAGLIQVTTVWLVTRGRLAEADGPLACLVTGAVLVFDRLRSGDSWPTRGRPGLSESSSRVPLALPVLCFARTRAGPVAPSASGDLATQNPCRAASNRVGSARWQWAFFALLGATALAKGIGFGAVLVGAVVILVLLWDRDRAALRALKFPRGWALAGVLGLAWPAWIVPRYPSALGLWMVHVTDRFAARPEHFSSEPWWLYGSALLWQTLPWTPLALIGAWPSLRRAIRQRGGPDRLLWAWAVGPAVLVSLASVRNGHYLIYALPPWSVWAALGLTSWAHRLRCRGWRPRQLHRLAAAGFAGLGLAYGIGFAWLGPWFDRRGVEWSFYATVGRALSRSEPLALLYDDLDHHKPYPSPYGPVPHDLAIRLFYLDRPASWWLGPEALVAHPPAPSFAVIGRERDLPALRRLGRVEVLARGPNLRPDRAFAVFRVTPGPESIARGSKGHRSMR